MWLPRNSHQRTITAALIACVLILCATGRAAAQSDPVFDAEGFQPNRAYTNELPFEHIDTFTGNLLLTFTDVSFPGDAGFGVGLMRTYNSKKPLDRGFGHGWNIAFVRVKNVDGTNPFIITPDGAQHAAYPRDPGATVYRTSDYWEYDSGAQTVRQPNGYVYQLGDAYGDTHTRYATVISDPFGNRLTVQYVVLTGAEQPVIKQFIQHLASGPIRTLTFDYSNGLLSTITWEGPQRVWRYSYETAGGYNVLTEMQPPAGPPWHYGYDSDGILSSITTPQGGVINYTYMFSQFASISGPNGRSLRTRVVMSRTTGGNVPAGSWTCSYATNTNEVTVSGPSTSTTYSYDINVSPMGDGVLTRRSTSSDGAVLETENFTWELGQPFGSSIGTLHTPSPEKVLLHSRALSRDGRTFTTTNAYRSTDLNDYGRPATVTETGELTRTTQYEYEYNFDPYIRDRVKQESLTVGSESFVKRWGYNPANGCRQFEEIYGVRIDYGRDAAGNHHLQRDPHGHQTTYGYAWGTVSTIQTPRYQITREINMDGTIASETRRASTTTFRYDELGREKVRQPPLGNPITTEYDATTTTVRRGTTVTVTTFDGFGRRIATSDAANIQTKTTYDPAGRKMFESDPVYGAPRDDRGTSYVYDGLDRIRRKDNRVEPFPACGSSEASGVTFNFSGNTVDITDENGHHPVQTFAAFGSPESGRLISVRDANGETTSYGYNALGKLTAVTHPDGKQRTWAYYPGTTQLQSETHPESGTVTYTYDGGLLKTRQDDRGLTTYIYDANDRLTLIDRPGTAYDALFGYDESDNRETAVNGYVSSTFGYDAANRLRTRRDVVAGYTFDTRIDYTNNDSVELIRYPSGRKVVYSYDDADRISQVQQESEVVADKFAYHPTGAIESYRAGNGLTHTISYDSRNRPCRVNAGGVFDSTYGYDLVGNVKEITDNTGRGRNQWFGYDWLDRLETFGGYTGGSYTYDDLGNRRSKTSGSSSTTYTYDEVKNRLASTSGMESASFTYDAVGNTKSDGTGTYSYTPANQLETAVVGGVTTTYRYDADDVRKVKETASGKRFYLHATSLTVLTEWSLSADKLQLERDYIYAGQRLIASMRSVPAGGTPEPVDKTPDQFAFPITKGATPGAVAASAIVQISGFNVGLPVSVSGAGEYRICGNDTCLAATGFTRGTLTIRGGDYLQLRATAAMTEGTTVKTTVTINGVSATWRLRTVGDPCGNNPEPGDDCDDGSYFAGYSPDGNAKMFTTPADAGVSQLASPEQVDHGYYDWNAGKANTYGEAQYSEYHAPIYCANLVVYGKSDWYLPAANEVNVLRLNAAAIGGFDMAAAYWSSTEWVVNGLPWGIYHRMSDGFSGYTTKGVFMPFRCVRRDMNANELTFVDRTRIPVNTVAYSNILLISSLSSPNYVSVSGNDGAFRICADATCSADPPFITARTRIAEGQYLQLRQTSGPTLLSVTNVTVTMGTLSDTWTVRTVGEPCTGSAPVGTVCDDGTVFSGYSPDGNVRMFTTPADAGNYQFAAPEDVDHGYSNWTTGKANTYGLAQYPEYQAPAYCANLVAYEKSDWYLPAPYEMSVLRVNAAAIGGFDMSKAYWTSAENGTVWAIYHRMSDGFSGYTTKGVFMPVRCVRRDMNAAEFTFADQTGVATNTTVYSNVLQVSGVGSAAAISVAGGGGAYRVCADSGCATTPAFISTASTIAEGQFVQLRLTSGAGFSSTVGTTITVAGLSDTWSVTTLAQDITPDAFTFTDRGGVARSSPVSSNILVITGITGTVSVSITGGGGTYRVCADASCSTQPPFVSGVSSITNGKYLQVQLTSSAAEATTTSTTVSVGAGSDTWSVTTAGDPCNGSPAPGTTCEDGSKFAGYSPDGNVKMFTTPADAGSYQFASRDDVDHGYNNWTTGKANTYGLAQYPEYRAPTYCANLVAHQKSDWYLPSPAEFSTVRTNAAAIGGFNMSVAYWTSAENGTVWAIYTRMSDGFQGYTTKGVFMPVRCVRRAMNASEFTFADQAGLALNAVTYSTTLQVTGLGGAAPVSITGGGGAYRVCNDATCSANPAFITTASTIAEGQFLQLRLTTGAAFSTAVSTTIAAAGYSDTWSATTAAQDITPNAFNFDDRTGVALGSGNYSSLVQITGITGAVEIWITGGSGIYRVCSDTACASSSGWTSGRTAISNGQYVQVYLVSSGANATTVSTTVTVGTVSDTWYVTTLGDPCTGSPAPGTTCADGTKFAGYSPDGGAKMYATPADFVSNFAAPEQVDHGYWNWTTGEYNTMGEAQYPEYQAPKYCANLVAYGKSDWYLPSPAEMSTLRANAAAIGGFRMDVAYWTSTEWGTVWAIYTRMSDGFQGYTTKGVWMWARCVRKDP